MSHYSKKSLMYRILDCLEEGSLDFEIMLEKLELQAPRYKGAGWLTKEKYKEKWAEIHEKENRLKEIQEERIDRVKFSKVLSRLKQSGLVTTNDLSHKSIFSITKKGKEKKQEFVNKIVKYGKDWEVYNIPKYPIKTSKELMVIIFDILEKDKRKRDWLRLTLIEMGFVKLQKSVWMCKCQLPEEFVEDLREMKILSNVVFFTVSKFSNMNLLDKMGKK